MIWQDPHIEFLKRDFKGRSPRKLSNLVLRERYQREFLERALNESSAREFSRELSKRVLQESPFPLPPTSLSAFADVMDIQSRVQARLTPI